MKFPDIKALGARLKPQPKKDEAIALAAELKPQPGKDEAIGPQKKKKISSSLRKIIGEKSVRHYDPDIHGPLVDAVIPPGYAEVDRYWVEIGRSIIIIATNTQTNQYQYLLFEPTLSEFEYELLERIHEDLRSALILTDEEIKKDRRELPHRENGYAPQGIRHLAL